MSDYTKPDLLSKFKLDFEANLKHKLNRNLESQGYERSYTEVDVNRAYGLCDCDDCKRKRGELPPLEVIHHEPIYIPETHHVEEEHHTPLYVPEVHHTPPQSPKVVEVPVERIVEKTVTVEKESKKESHTTLYIGFIGVFLVIFIMMGLLFNQHSNILKLQEQLATHNTELATLKKSHDAITTNVATVKTNALATKEAAVEASIKSTTAKADKNIVDITAL